MSVNQHAIPIVKIATIPEVFDTEQAVSSSDKPIVKSIIKSAVYEEYRWPYILTLPFSWLITFYVMVKVTIYKEIGIRGPKTNTFWFDGLGVWCRKVKEGASSWKALDIVYNHPFPKRFTLGGLVDEFYWYGLNCQALRNRFKLAKQELRHAILKFSESGEVRVISLACGSAQAMIEIVSEFKRKNVVVKVILVDLDQDALDYAMSLAKISGVSGQIETLRANAATVTKIAKDFKPQVIEMMGLLDYIDQEKAIRFVEKIHEALEPKGIFLTCNIAPNSEMHFLKWVINWPMVYRKPRDLAEIAIKTGFDGHDLVYEPLKIHGILIAQKS